MPVSLPDITKLQSGVKHASKVEPSLGKSVSSQILLLKWGLYLNQLVGVEDQHSSVRGAQDVLAVVAEVDAAHLAAADLLREEGALFVGLEVVEIEPVALHSVVLFEEGNCEDRAAGVEGGDAEGFFGRQVQEALALLALGGEVPDPEGAVLAAAEEVVGGGGEVEANNPHYEVNWNTARCGRRTS